MKITGDLTITKENQNDFAELVEVTGDLRVDGSAKLDALQTIGGDLIVFGSAKLDAPQLQTVGGCLRVYGSAKLDALQTIGGDLIVDGSAKLDALQTIGGDLIVFGSAKLDALQTIGGDLIVDGSAKLDAPQLQTVGGYLRVDGSAKLDAPLLTNKNDPKAKTICELALAASFRIRGLIKIDGILSWILGEKTIGEVTALEIKIVGKLTASFAVKRGDLYAHGDTVKEAIEELRFKFKPRDVSEFLHWKENPEQEVSLDDAMAAYNAITGACRPGIRHFIQTHQIPEKLTPKVILKITEESYQHQAFREFLTV